MAELYQPRVLDIHEYYRTGGTNWVKVKENFDAVIIRACVGFDVDELLIEHVDLAEEHEVDYETYAVPVRWLDPVDQADFYLDLYGVADAPIYGDIEPSGGQIVSGYQARKFFERLDQRHIQEAGYYSNLPYTNDIGNPAWIKERFVWWAEYRYQILTYKYRKYEPFLDKYPWWSPRWATSLGITPSLHQITDKGDAQFYAANPTTNDPYYKTGIKSADLNVGLITLENYKDKWLPWKPIEPEPDPDPPDTHEEIWKAIKANKDQIVYLSGKVVELDARSHTHTEPDPEPPIDNGFLYKVKSDKAVAWEQSGSNSEGLPVYETNAYQKYGYAILKFKKDDILRAYRPPVVANNGDKYLKLDQDVVTANLYMKQTDIMKLE